MCSLSILHVHVYIQHLYMHMYALYGCVHTCLYTMYSICNMHVYTHTRECSALLYMYIHVIIMLNVQQCTYMYIVHVVYICYGGPLLL